MQIQGAQFLGSETSRQGGVVFNARDPKTGTPLEPAFADATPVEITAACRLADEAARPFAEADAQQRAEFLRAIGARITDLGDSLIERAEAETALPRPRLENERGRTVGQLEMFADLVADGSWVDARIDRGQPDRRPLPKPDLRRMLVPVGPVAVFGASNFPLAFSVAGGDTASALAAACPVVVKAHPAHPGTSELVARAVLQAAADTKMPDSVLTMVQGKNHIVGTTLVSDPRIQAVAFTGSLRGGRALYNTVAAREQLIPMYAEMGSVNPVFVLPGALAERAQQIADNMVSAVNLGCGQFCTNPGMAVVLDDDAGTMFVKDLGEKIGAPAVGTMVSRKIAADYEATVGEIGALEGVHVVARAAGEGTHAAAARPTLFTTTLDAYRRLPRLRHEIYGPATVALRCRTAADMIALARSLHGHLTATVHATAEDLEHFADLIEVLGRKVGRLILNGMPTGVEVGPAMHHGGPYPATTDVHSTSVGTAAILRFARPLCYQDFPQDSLPRELQDHNPRGIWRTVDGKRTQEPI